MAQNNHGIHTRHWTGREHRTTHPRASTHGMMTSMATAKKNCRKNVEKWKNEKKKLVLPNVGVTLPHMYDEAAATTGNRMPDNTLLQQYAVGIALAAT